MPFKRGQLQKFVTVADEGQITRAARKLDLAQPSLSQAISHLEGELGILLLERHGRSVTLTPAGETFLPKARLALSAHADADAFAQSLARAARGTVALGFLGLPPTAHTPELFAMVAAQHPDIELSFRELPLPRGATASWLREVDVALCHLPIDEQNIASQRLRSEQRVLIVPSTHRLAGSSRLTVAEVLDETFLGYSREVNPAWSAFWSLDDHRGSPAKRLATEHMTAIEMLAALPGADAVTTVPACHADAIALAVPALLAIPLVDASPAELMMVWRRDSANPLVGTLAAVAGHYARLYDGAEREASEPGEHGLTGPVASP